jgi:hypothetical protein
MPASSENRHFGTASSGRKVVPIVLGSAALHTLVALVVPDSLPMPPSNVLARYLAWLSSVVPSIPALMAVSQFPATTRIVLCMLWTSAPVICIALLLSRSIDFNMMHLRQRRYQYPLLLLVGLSIVIVLAIFQGFDGSTAGKSTMGELAIQMMSTSRVLLGIISGLMAFFIGAYFALVVEWAKIASKLFSG